MLESEFHEKAVTELFAKAAANQKIDPDWINSPYLPVLAMPSVSQAVLARTILLSWAMINRIDMAKAEGRRNAVLVHGIEMGIKFSTMWSGRRFRFQQLQPGRYSHNLCLGLSPDNVYLWVVPDSVFQADLPGISKQHSTADRWIDVAVDDQELWINSYGRNFEKAAQILGSLARTQS